MPFSGSNYYEGTFYRPQPLFVLDALSTVICGWEDRARHADWWAQKSLQVEISLLAAVGEILKQADGLRKAQYSEICVLGAQILKKSIWRFLKKIIWHVIKEALLYFANIGVSFRGVCCIHLQQVGDGCKMTWVGFQHVINRLNLSSPPLV